MDLPDHREIGEASQEDTALEENVSVEMVDDHCQFNNAEFLNWPRVCFGTGREQATKELAAMRRLWCMTISSQAQ